MNQATLLEKKETTAVSAQKQGTTLAGTNVASATKLVLVIGLGAPQHRLGKELESVAAKVIFVNSPRKAMPFLLDKENPVSAVAIFPQNTGGVGSVQKIKDVGYVGPMVIGSDARNAKRDYLGKGSVVMVKETTETLLKILNK
jgi:hypothetical protein